MIRAYQARVRETMARFGGFVARYVGDGVLIYFGWPAAQETDAERAVRAALAVVSSVSNVPVVRESLQVRIGIATGVVVVGEPIGAGDARQQTAIGETPNRAARLQGLAAASGVVIDATTRQQVGALFECYELKGLPQPIQAWIVQGESAVESRFEALRATGLAPLIGRTEELELLVRRWQRAQTGEGQVVLLAGEAGIGKSRPTAALREQIKQAPHLRVSWFCSPHHQDSSLHPIIAQLQRTAGFQRADTDEARWAKLEALLAPTALAAGDVALLGDLLSLSGRDAPEGSGANRQHEHARTRCAQPPSGPEHCIPDCGRSSALSTKTSYSELPLVDAVHQLDAGDRDRRIMELLEAKHYSDPLFDASMVLLNKVIQVFGRA